MVIYVHFRDVSQYVDIADAQASILDGIDIQVTQLSD